jgi:hypothetical protein
MGCRRALGGQGGARLIAQLEELGTEEAALRVCSYHVTAIPLSTFTTLTLEKFLHDDVSPRAARLRPRRLDVGSCLVGVLGEEDACYCTSPLHMHTLKERYLPTHTQGSGRAVHQIRRPCRRASRSCLPSGSSESGMMSLSLRADPAAVDSKALVRIVRHASHRRQLQ